MFQFKEAAYDIPENKNILLLSTYTNSIKAGNSFIMRKQTMFCLVPIIANTAYLTNPWLVRVKAGINLRGIISYLNIELFHLLQRLIKQ